MEENSELQEHLARLNEIVGQAETILTVLTTKRADIDAAQLAVIADKVAIETALSEAKTLLQSIESTKTQSEQSATLAIESLTKLKANAQEEAKELTTLTKKATDLESNVDESTQKIEELISSNSQNFAELTTKIEGLLPGATSAGLAYAFETRRQAISASQRYWKWTFIGSLGSSFVAGLCLLSGYLPFGGGDTSSLDWTQFVRGILPRLILLSPLFWLAGFSAKQLSVRFRLEEDYAHKEALSRAFEGYKREMSTMTESSKVAGDLANVVISALGDPPVRLYDKHISTESPLDKVKDVVARNKSEKT